MNQPKIYWLLDEIFAETHPKDWGEVVTLASKLIGLIGTKEVTHQIVNPIDSFQKLIGKLKDQNISTIIDISGWIGYGLEPLFPQATLVKDFSLGRILDVSTTDFKNAGFVMNMSPDEVSKRAIGVNLSHVLIVDDASVSGRTNKMVMDAWGIKPTNAIHASLLANTGDFPTARREQKKQGAVSLLEGLGSTIFYGYSMVTPQDDAEHLRDIFQHSNLEQGFDTALRLHDLITTSEDYSTQLQSFLTNDESGKMLFPQQLSEEDIIQLSKEGRLIRNTNNTPSENALFVRNPILWAFNDFWKKLDETSLRENKTETLTILKRFQQFRTGTEGILEVRNSLRGTTGKVLGIPSHREIRPNGRERKI